MPKRVSLENLKSRPRHQHGPVHPMFSEIVTPHNARNAAPPPGELSRLPRFGVDS